MTDGDNYDTPHSILTRSDSHTESTASDSDSSVAPTDFQLSESFECSAQGAAVSVALERCWLCLGSRRSFHCKQCVRTGDFVHSRPLQQPFQPLRPLADLERWATRLLTWACVKRPPATPAASELVWVCVWPVCTTITLTRPSVGPVVFLHMPYLHVFFSLCVIFHRLLVKTKLLWK